MQFRSKVTIPLSNVNKINHCHKIAMIGSCFAQNIGERLEQDKFDVSINPCGILFNPISVAKAIKSCFYQTLIIKNQIRKEGEQWLSLDHHSRFNSISSEETLSKINQSILDSKDYYINGDYLIITLGTAWVYEFKETKEIVANCHKIPNTRFLKILLSIDEIVTIYSTLFIELLKKNSSLKIIFTISPVRHWKDGVVENNRSKSVLHLAIMELVSLFKSVSYFPSYEIVIDELRDYRFYKEDMLHPSDQAVDYIYERFSELYYTKETVDLNLKIRKISLALAHRPFNLNSKSHQLFLINTQEKMKQFKIDYPYLEFK